MKRLFVCMTVLSLLLNLAACGQSPTKTSAQDALQEQEAYLPKEASLSGNQAEIESYTCKATQF